MPPGDGSVSPLRRIAGDRGLRRVLPAFLGFNAAEGASWVAILLYAYDRTGPASLGIVAVIQLLPAALLAPAAASLGDRFPRERVLSLGYLVQAAAMLATAAAIQLDLPVAVVLGFATIAAVSLVVTRPTQSALLPSLARTPGDLTAANGALGMVEGLGTLGGPLIAAAILTGSTPAAVFAVSGLALLVAWVGTARLRPVAGLATLSDDAGPGGVPEAAAPGDPAPGDALAPGGAAAADRATDAARADDPAAERGILAGLRVVLDDRDARVVIAILTAQYVMIGAADVLFVLLALDLLDLGEPGAGLLGAAFGGGIVVGGALTFAFAGRGRLAIVAVAGSLTWGLAIAAVGLSASAILAPMLVIIGGAGLTVVNIAGRTMLQRSIRDAVLGRVFGLQEGLAMVGLAAGSLLVPFVVAIGGLAAGTVAVALLMPLIVGGAWRGLADLDRRSIVPVAQIELLRRTALFRPLPAPQLEAVARRAVWLTLAAGTPVIREGERGDRFYVLASGALRVDREGRHLRDLTEPGDGFGEIALLRGVPRTATVTTIAATTLLAVDRAPFLAAVTGHPDAFTTAERVVAGRAM